MFPPSSRIMRGIEWYWVRQSTRTPMVRELTSSSPLPSRLPAISPGDLNVEMVLPGTKLSYLP